MFEQLERKLNQLMADAQLELLAKQARILVLHQDLAEKLYKGETSMIVSPTEEEGTDLPKLLIADAAYIYGVAELAKSRSMSLAEFRREEEQHGMTDEFRKRWWPRSRRLYSYDVQKFVRLDEPLAWLPDTLPLPEPRFSSWPDPNVLKGVDLQPLANAAALMTQTADLLRPVASKTLALCEPLDELRELLIMTPTILQKAAASIERLEELQGSGYVVTTSAADNLYDTARIALAELEAAKNIREIRRHEPAAWIELAKEALEALPTARARLGKESMLAPSQQAMRPGEYGTEQVICPSCGEELDVVPDVVLQQLEIECPVCGEYFYPGAAQTAADQDVFAPLTDDDVKDMSADDLIKRHRVAQAALAHMEKLDEAKRAELKYTLDEARYTVDVLGRAIARKEELLALYNEKVEPYKALEGEEKARPAVIQAHFIGKRAHIDMRYDAGDHLLGLELAAQRAGWSRIVQSLDEAKKLADGFDIAGCAWSRTLKRSRVPIAFKDPEPRNWLDVEAEEFAMGAVGASELHQGYVVKLASPVVSLGMRNDTMHEYFIENGGNFSGLLVVKQRNDTWLAGYSASPIPHVLRKAAVKNGVVPPKGWSCLPPAVKAAVPKQYRYWLEEEEAKRIEVRNALVDAEILGTETIRMVDGAFHVVKVSYEIVKPQEQSLQLAKAQRVQGLIKQLGNLLGAKQTVADEEGGIGFIPTQPACQSTVEESTCQEKEAGLEVEDTAVGVVKRFTDRRRFSIRRLLKQESERYIFGEVLVPDEYDAHNDIYTAEEVRKAFEHFVENADAAGLLHTEALDDNQLHIMDNYTALTDFEYEGRVVKAGTWLMGARVLDDTVWSSIVDEKLTGWSIEGSAIAHFIDGDTTDDDEQS